MFDKPFLFDRAEKAFAKGCKENPSMLLEKLDSVISLIIKFPHRHHILKGVIDVLKNQSQLFQQYFANLWRIPYELIKNSKNKKERINAIQSLFIILDSIPENLMDSFKPLVANMLEVMWPNIKEII